MKRNLFFCATALFLLTLVSYSATAAPPTKSDIAFVAYNADEDGWAIVTFVDLDPNTQIYFTDNEATSATALNTGEVSWLWNTGTNIIRAGTVIRFSSVNTSSRAASVGSFTTVTVTPTMENINDTQGETVYAYIGTSDIQPTTFLTAVSTATAAAASQLTTAGLTPGTDAVLLLESTDFGQYTGPRSGLTSFAAYKALVYDSDNWEINLTGNYGSVVPNTANFTISPTVTLSGTSSICEGQSATLSVSIVNGASPYSLTISNGSTTSAISSYTSGQGIIVSPMSSTTYTVIALTDANSVSASPSALSGTAIVTISSPPPTPTYTLTNNGTVCVGTPLVITANGCPSGTVNFTINPATPSGSVVSPSYTFTGDTPPGTYTVCARCIDNATGCSSPMAITTVTIAPNPTITITLTFPGGTVTEVSTLPTIQLPTPGQVLIQASGGTSYNWVTILDRINGYEVRKVDNNTSGLFTVDKPGPYRVTVTGANGCTRTVEGLIVN